MIRTYLQESHHRNRNPIIRHHRLGQSDSRRIHLLLLASFAHILGSLGALLLLFRLFQRLQLTSGKIFRMIDSHNVKYLNLVVDVKMRA